MSKEIQLNRLAVFCGSSSGNDLAITEAAQNLGKLMVEQQIELVYGAAKIGVMGDIAKAVLDSGGQVIGVIPEFLKRKELVHFGLSQLITTENMHQRKLEMSQLSDGFIALPGGFGTLEELFEIITWSQLGLHQKPVGLLNINGFYDPLLALLEGMVRKGFLKLENFEILLVANQPQALLNKMRSYKPKAVPKWLTRDRT